MNDKWDPQGPADTRTMRIVHNALRRDLTRATSVIGAAPHPHPDQREAIAEHLLFMMRFLHHHHSGEDAGLYPLVRAKNPEATVLLDEMDADHESIEPGMEALVAAAERYASEESAGPDVLAAIASLEQTLLPHLRREEEEMMPVVAASITWQEWEDWTQTYNVKPRPKRELAHEGLWIMEGQAPEDQELMARLVPPVPRWIILNVLSRGYRKETFRRWQDQVDAPWPLLVRGGNTVDVEATPEQVWAVLSDVRRVPAWSHECRQVTWLDDVTEGRVGARFKGTNRSGFARWQRPCTITGWEPGRRLTFETRGPLGMDATEWTFELEPHGTGTRLTQTFRILEMAGWWGRLVWRTMPAHRDRRPALREDLIRLAELALTQEATAVTAR
jgi:hemerythrin-like domain-containing protein